MPAERYYIENPLIVHETVLLKDTEFHHLSRVMRTRVGETVELVNGQGILANAVVVDILKDRAALKIEETSNDVPRQMRVILAQAIPKPNRLENILEKGTELGVDEFWLFPSQHSLKKDFSENQMERLQTVTISALKQCGRLILPQITLKPPLKEWADFQGAAFFGDTEETAPLFLNVWKEISLSSPLIFCVGPESGFTDDETELLKTKGAHGVKLHQNILRTDTASLVALSLIEYWLLETQ
ncbi:MAG: 16S rRNA (uracil(1498)-N(3))-methyltransferase [Parachlamydiaceae bacterium]|nr:16S rRNA (uracil(1498)-N(3))-methyltransferase [Parachlamydiaceae bacterium]